MADVALTPDDLKTLSTAKTLSLIGTCIGLAGTIYAMKANPVTRTSMDNAWSMAPAALRENKNFTLLAGAAILALIVAKYVSSRN